MSLLDSLLVLDAPKLDVWIAVRTDGVKGSGTESDPYNGSPRQESAISITIANSAREATATATNHGYNNGDVVVISGVGGAGAAQFNGRFSIYDKTNDTFK